MKRILLFLLFAFSLGFNAIAQLYVSAEKHNELLKVFKSNSVTFQQFTSNTEAIKAAKNGAGVLLFAQGYPEERNVLTAKNLQDVKKKRLKVYIEYPASFNKLTFRDTLHKVFLERVVVSSNALKPLDSLSILALNDMSLLMPTVNSKTYLTAAKVAGFDYAEYGYSDVDNHPVLFMHSNVLVSTTKLSNAITGRFGPTDSWKAIWNFIINKVDEKQGVNLVNWPKSVYPSFSEQQSLPLNALNNSIKRGVDWYYNARFFIHPNWQNLTNQVTNQKNVVHNPVPRSYKNGDGSLGVLEGHYSKIKHDGTQNYRWWLRADCQVETAYALANAANFLNDTSYANTANNLLKYLFEKSNLTRKHLDPATDPSRGLIGWATTNPDVFYGDDNARLILALIGSKVNLKSSAWDKQLIENILGNYRTSNKIGFRKGYLRDTTIAKLGLEDINSGTDINAHPHYESWLWACYLWLYDQTKYEPLLTKAKSAITITMQKYPDWKWTNGVQQERARMLLPLAWLVKVDDSPLHRKWLYTIADKLLSNLQESGAIKEELGTQDGGRYAKILSNKEYGSREAPIIANNGDAVADLLYTTNFAFFTLNEAAHAVDDARLKGAVKEIRDFLIRAQVTSQKHPDLDGAWFRAFDYKRWDYWASNADSGWGPWGTLTGWTQSWILNTMILTKQQTSFWDQSRTISQDEKFKILAKQLINEML